MHRNDYVLTRRKAYTNEWRTCLKYRIKRKTVSTILIAKEKWLTTDSDEYTAQLKRNRPSKYENVERALWSWVKGALSCNLDITGAVMETAKEDVSLKNVIQFKP